jgi:diguanylate cyclase (GGDEF)-like protein
MAQDLSLALAAAAAAGAVAGWLAARRRSPSAGPGHAPGLVVSDASLDWLRGMLGARAVWALSPMVGSEPAVRLTSGDPTLGAHELAAVEHRVAEARSGGRHSVERLETDTLVLRARGGAVAAALMPVASGSAALDVATAELDRLLEALERSPRLTAMARADLNPGHLESLESVAHRLAFELEALTGGDVIVGAVLAQGLTVVGLGGSADARLEGAVAPSDTPLARAIREGSDVVHTSDPPLGWRAADRRSQQRPAVMVVMEQGGAPLGGVVIWPRGGRLAASALAHAEAAVRRAAPRVSRAREAYELRTAASRDPLTGLANRRQLQLAMHDAVTADGALVMLDIDHFKRLNDTLGHPAGDDALLQVAGILRRETRAGDLVARVGGEEFALWLPGTSLGSAVRLAERVRRTLELATWTWQGAPWPLTASFGVAHWGETTSQVDNLMAQADAALYQSKQAGRNRVTSAAG